MNKVWPWIMLISLCVGIINGRVQEMTSCIFDSSKQVIETAMTIFGIISLWSGLMKIAEKTGVIEKAKVIVYPFIKILFPELKRESNAVSSIAMNMTANMIGLGNVATPLGIRAMEELQEENKNKNRLSKPMMMLLVLNMSSIQIIPTTVIALRSTYGSQNPTEIVLPVIISSFVAVICGVLIVKIFYKDNK